MALINLARAPPSLASSVARVIHADSLSVATGETPILIDYSKNIITAETLSLLLDLARERGVEAGRAAMFRGDRINITENRPV